MNFTTAVRTCFNKYVTFSGRATRPEYWYFVLFLFVGGIVAGLADAMIFGVEEDSGELLSILFSLATFLPSLAVGARRLHDIGRSGWWLLIGLVPIIGAIVLIVWFATKSQDGANDYGPDPHGLWT